jgi:hypothetical protein
LAQCSLFQRDAAGTHQRLIARGGINRSNEVA